MAAHPDIIGNYDSIGSGAGRTQFLAGAADWVGSDVPLRSEELDQARGRYRGVVVEVPDYVSPATLVYNLPGVPTCSCRR